MRASVAAPNTTRASFAISDGWTVTGPRRNQRDAPYASIPWVGISTRTSIAIVRIRKGPANRFHASYRMRDVTSSARTPTTA